MHLVPFLHACTCLHSHAQTEALEPKEHGSPIQCFLITGSVNLSCPLETPGKFYELPRWGLGLRSCLQWFSRAEARACRGCEDRWERSGFCGRVDLAQILTAVLHKEMALHPWCLKRGRPVYPANTWEMRILRLQPRPTQSAASGAGAQPPEFWQVLRVILMGWRLRTPDVGGSSFWASIYSL